MLNYFDFWWLWFYGFIAFLEGLADNHVFGVSLLKLAQFRNYAFTGVLPHHDG